MCQGSLHPDSKSYLLFQNHIGVKSAYHNSLHEHLKWPNRKWGRIQYEWRWNIFLRNFGYNMLWKDLLPFQLIKQFVVPSHVLFVILEPQIYPSHSN